VLTAPFTPMLFMGEEWGADTPWQYFTDHTDPDLARAVSAGRKSEFAAHGWGAEQIPDPQDKETFLRSKLDWSQPGREPHRSLLDWYRSLLSLRRARPELTDPRLDRVRVGYDEDARWLLVRRGPLRIAANLGAAGVQIPLTRATAPQTPAHEYPPASPAHEYLATRPPPVGAGRPPILILASEPDISVNSEIITLPPASFAVIDSR